MLKPIVKLNGDDIEYTQKAIHLGTVIGSGADQANIKKAISNLHVSTNICDASSLCMLGAPLSSFVQDQWKRSVSDGEAALASAVAELRDVVRGHLSSILSIAEARRLLLEFNESKHFTKVHAGKAAMSEEEAEGDSSIQRIEYTEKVLHKFVLIWSKTYLCKLQDSHMIARSLKSFTERAVLEIFFRAVTGDLDVLEEFLQLALLKMTMNATGILTWHHDHGHAEEG
ncbi:hypothetical protein CAPTEDRAFT_192388 [Capitella teleta]|uniref:Uncharacterized protein n=1 Tax=Capitella teleta TaxID=283909 RepID=R7U254_CAPTE|nr:hypothetical protein CAPTEDRAFT_192388 [Capitella teleta]|eukprot:ELT97250.1 hypothetical protein CAPTEDRAFT_192388 [Capitella teleta]